MPYSSYVPKAITFSSVRYRLSLATSVVFLCKNFPLRILLSKGYQFPYCGTGAFYTLGIEPRTICLNCKRSTN